jgi:uncharacterized membrane protein YjgN (DUF898 family)
MEFQQGVAQAARLTPPDSESYRFSYQGEGGAFFLLLLKNILLTVITLGMYAAWAKTERRKYIWSNVEIHGQRLKYTGTGKEVFIAYLKLAAFYVAFIGGPFVVGKTVSKEASMLVQASFVLGLVALIPFAIYWVRAYLLSRTQWRGIRFGLVEGGAGQYAKTFLGGYLLTLLTLGIYGPFWINNLRRIITKSTRLGSEPFEYDGVGKDVFWIAFKGVLLSIVTLGIYSFWMQAELQRYYLEHTAFSGARGRSEMTGGFVLKIMALNLLGTTLTLGIAFPWITTYTFRAVLQRITFEGHVDFDAITQSAAVAGAGGEALANALDVGFGV